MILLLDTRLLPWAAAEPHCVPRPARASGEHAVATIALPPLHKDPFDRVLVAQATTEGYTLLTADPTVAAYPGPIQYVT